MSRITRHPLQIKADAVKKAMVLNGFSLYDYGDKPHIIPADVLIDVIRIPAECKPETMYLLDGSYALRTSLLQAELSKLDSTLPVKTLSVGWVFDGSDKDYPNFMKAEGIIADNDLSVKKLQVLWSNIVKDLYGIGTKAELVPSECGNLAIRVVPNGSTSDSDDAFNIGVVGKATTIAKALLRLEDPSVDVWSYSMGIDRMAIREFGLDDRAALFNNEYSNIAAYECDAAAFGNDSIAKATDILRQLGYNEYIGEKVYTDDAYSRMNMIQESWDTNNKGVSLVKPLDEYNNPLTECTERTALPTVLAPALQQAMSDNFAAGEEAVKIFEISHISKPKIGKAPSEKVSISFGAYGKDLTLADFKKDFDAFLTQFGISNHFFIPNDVAIAYKKGQCLLVLDEKMQYLDCNGGHIADRALENFKIDAEGFMAQFELPTLEAKAAEEFDFVPYENR